MRYSFNAFIICLSLAGTLLIGSCQNRNETLFETISSNKTGIHFNNMLDEDENTNVNLYMNIYTGGGVAVGDINNDGLADIFFSGNAVSSRLYLNKGDLHFEDITESSGILNKSWGTGAVMADVNQDGWIDIYLCVSGSAENRSNLLFINNKDNTFTESAKTYGIDDKRQSMHASFFDYDGDEDLDLFIITNRASFENNVNNIQPRKLKGEGVSTDILYRNNGDNTFTDVSFEAGILVEGYSLGLAISDINTDGWPDIYISNDFIGNDILYINNKNGTFSNRAGEYFKHTSFAGMGNDIADINNDGLVDVVELDMRPEDNRRQKLIIPPTGYDKYKLSLRMGYEPQFSRNTFQLNRGNNKFSEISFLAGISSTDWSWSPLVADYDNDGDKDLFATNGFLRDLGNMDYITYQNIYNTPLGTVQSKTDKKLSAIKALEGAVLSNYMYENNGSLQFVNQSAAWGFDAKNVSHGAAYSDLDNDGDLDLVVNNMNSKAQIYQNKSNQIHHRNYLRIKFEGSPLNKDGIGAKVTAHYNNKTQYVEHFLNRGYESTVDNIMHIGMDTVSMIDSLTVTWPDGKSERLRRIKTNQLLTIKYGSAKENEEIDPIKTTPLFTDVTDQLGIIYNHKENDFVDFKVQPLLPHMHSASGPGIAVSDVNGDGLDDVYFGGSMNHCGAMFIQQQDGRFKKQSSLRTDSLSDNMGVLLFDADNDNDSDLYIVSGGSEHIRDSPSYKDHLYINDGEGHFKEATSSLPDLYQSGSCVNAADYDRDGDLDLFVGGRLTPGQYPLPADSYILRNDSDRTGCRFTDVTREIAPHFSQLGMVTSSLWTDIDNDGWVDLAIVGEFMPISFFKNNNGKSFTPIGKESLAHSSGWWNSITGGDFDNDGDIDYIAGNLGLNTRYHGNSKEPVCLYAKDYDKNGSIDPVMTYYLQGQKHIVHARDELISQMSVMRLRFRKYKEYSEKTFDESFIPSELESAYVVCSEQFETSYIENLGDGKFSLTSLPAETQFAPVNGILVDDYNQDGYLDILTAGNLYASEVNTGRYDASIGLLLYGNGGGKFTPVNAKESGFVADSDAKGLAELTNKNGNSVVLIGNNSASFQAYYARVNFDRYVAGKNDAFAEILLKNGKSRRYEFYYGSTYLSQSSRQIKLEGSVKIEVYDFQGKKRERPISVR